MHYKTNPRVNSNSFSMEIDKCNSSGSSEETSKGISQKIKPIQCHPYKFQSLKTFNAIQIHSKSPFNIIEIEN